VIQKAWVGLVSVWCLELMCNVL